MPLRVIERFLIERADFITSALDKFSSSEAYSFDYNDGDKLMMLGREYRVKNEISSGNRAMILNDHGAIIYTADNSPRSRRKAVMKLYERICESEIMPICNEVFECLKSVYPKMPEVNFRKAKSRWGSCYSTKNKIVLNKLLAAVPRECITYVIYHEFIHFLHPNHSPRFYESLGKYLPEHRVLKKMLNDYSYILEFPSER